jgi:hypothetical protein
VTAATRRSRRRLCSLVATYLSRPFPSVARSDCTASAREPGVVV